ncbi:Brain and acute leukemia cytoplasmic protein [Cricetulus griseus]|uniref:Brain and acute leukemia cytoplasmic protein n=1 Tax=Cricetulus griseus TaxID=10029 RepID=G3I3N4_CRIGR|nr:Brain and acute leukemia cytoplasmic protein [Cricetulus griseus]
MRGTAVHLAKLVVDGISLPPPFSPTYSVFPCALKKGSEIKHLSKSEFIAADRNLSSPLEEGVLEDGLSSNGVLRSAASGGIANPEKKMNCGTQCPNSQSLSGPLTQKQNGLWTTEAKRDAKRMSAKEVTINVTENLRQMDRSKRIAKNCVN